MKYRENTLRRSDSAQLGKKLQTARTKKSMSKYRLSALTGVHRRTIANIEDGLIRNPNPEILALLAEQLDLTIADLYPLVGYMIPNQLPDFDGYMAAKFQGLPPEAVQEIAGHLNYLQAKHGLDPTG